MHCGMFCSPHKCKGLGGHQMHVLNGAPFPKVVKNDLAQLQAKQAGCAGKAGGK